MDFDSSSTVMEFKHTFPIPEGLYWDGKRFDTISGYVESEATADMYTNLLSGFIAGLEASGRMTDFTVEPFNRNP
ncbi:hypothetical protein ACV28C_000387 [Enterobacter asburiae]|uniref:Uncharacterized protein n=1 Tax=Enterobacter asburiae TaxID=61645 RepID=A0AAW7ZQW8_ENTAS|nr:hypothetical protein [Enterobacter asburiae]MCU2339344.1 hypothetical protein [Enterobacter hormaechei subsp. steigerwaltii]MCV5680642.1 hypothetical protein [Escherichia coli]AZL61977.1 hypothetical protein EI562_02735 [Enterobacter asburiae]EMB8996222.1 hypothetical protein [Enterobacter asburiae]ESM31176.1 hypothetical protein L402_03478 [Enterobacter asburiae]